MKQAGEGEKGEMIQSTVNADIYGGSDDDGDDDDGGGRGGVPLQIYSAVGAAAGRRLACAQYRDVV